MSLEIKRLAGSFGVEVSGIDLNGEIGANLFRTIHQAWLDHDGVMVVRDQRLTPASQLAFASRFGTVRTPDPPEFGLPDYPMVYSSAFDVADAPKLLDFTQTGAAWHSDYAYETEWAGASLLYVRAMPPKGGDILFADLYAAYDALSASMRAFLAPLKAVQRPVPIRRHDDEGDPAAVHPMVRTHPETGRQALYVSPGFTTEIVGLAPAESEALLKFLAAHCTQPQFVLRHHWVPGDLVVWDNRCNLHYALGDYSGGGRVDFQRVAVNGG